MERRLIYHFDFLSPVFRALKADIHISFVAKKQDRSREESAMTF
jgi:hypothetical protein